jgi:hypothetical protein
MAETPRRDRPWTRVVLIDPDGDLLWRDAPPGGTWKAEHPFEALSFANPACYEEWLARQSRTYQVRLAEGRWEPIEATISFRPLPGTERSIPVVADAACEVGGA